MYQYAAKENLEFRCKSVFLKADYRRCIFVAVLLGLGGCNQPLEDSVAKQMESENQLANSATANTQGKKLTEVAERPPCPRILQALPRKKFQKMLNPMWGVIGVRLAVLIL